MKNIFKNISLKFDRSFSRGIFKQVLWLAGIMVVVYGILVAMSYVESLYNPSTALQDSHGRWYDILFLLMDAGSMTSAMKSPFIALCGLMGLVIFCGMLISLISNVLERRVNSFLHGENNYKTENHVVILGYNESIPSLLDEIHKKHKNSLILLMSELDASMIRNRIHASVTYEIEKHVVLLKGTRQAEEDLKRLNLSNHVKEIYVLGEKNEVAHDMINMECVKLLARLIPQGTPVECHVQIDSHTMFSVLQSVDFGLTQLNENGDQIKNHINFLPFNFNEIWAQKALATVSPQSALSEAQDNQFFPLDDKGITNKSKRHVHLVIIGLNDMATALAVNAAHILHFPNYKEGDFTTCSTVTIIDNNIDKGAVEFRNRFRYLFQLARWRQIKSKHCLETDSQWIDPMIGSSNPYNYLGTTNFMDIQWEFIDGDVFDDDIQAYLETCSSQEDDITTIALCGEDSEYNANLCLALPDSIHKTANMILVRQKENPIITNLINHLPNHDRVRSFGMMSECYRENLTSDKYGKIINACYRGIDIMNMASPEVAAEVEKAWDECSVLNKWSSVYSANMLLGKLRSMGLEYDESVTEENVARLFVQEDINDGLQRMEHNRWVTEKLLLGFSPLTEQEKGIWLASKQNEKELRKQKKHIDICPNSALPTTESLKDDKVNSNLWLIYKLLKKSQQS